MTRFQRNIVIHNSFLDCDFSFPCEDFTDDQLREISLQPCFVRFECLPCVDFDVTDYDPNLFLNGEFS